MVVLYVPATHCVHALPCWPVEPVLQVQSISSLLATAELENAGQPKQTFDVAATLVEYVFTGQFVHTPAPAITLYVPAAHGAHAAPFAPVYPALHSHVLLPAGESEFMGHA